MNGVIVWRNHSQAVIWCEDQGPLAYCEPEALSRAPDIGKGDLVHFITVERDGLRFANGLSCLKKNAAPGLASDLSGDKGHQDSGPEADNVIAFPQL